MRRQLSYRERVAVQTKHPVDFVRMVGGIENAGGMLGIGAD